MKIYSWQIMQLVSTSTHVYYNYNYITYIYLCIVIQMYVSTGHFVPRTALVARYFCDEGSSVGCSFCLDPETPNGRPSHVVMEA
jgi:hypothetical protein